MGPGVLGVLLVVLEVVLEVLEVVLKEVLEVLEVLLADKDGATVVFLFVFVCVLLLVFVAVVLRCLIRFCCFKFVLNLSVMLLFFGTWLCLF